MRTIAPSFRILRRAGSRLVDVSLPAMGIDALSLHAVDAATALRNAKTLGVTGQLVAVAEAS